MSTERDREALDPREAREAELVAWLLDPAARAARERAELERDADEARLLSELEGFVARCRAAGERFEELGGTRRRQLVERVLAGTTREDLSWRGDLRLFGRFVAQRLRSSPGLRLAAASLLVHLFALPLWAAWYGLRQQAEQEQQVVRFEPYLPLPGYDEAREAEPELESPAPAAPELELELPERDEALYVENSLAWARSALREPLPVLGEPGADEGRAGELLRARLEALRGAAPAAAAPAADGSLAERALWAELQLDRALVAGAPEALEPALLALVEPRYAGADGRLAAAALARAESYGLLPRGAADALWQARRDLAGISLAEALVEGERDLRRVAPFGPAWREALVAAAGELALAPALARALDPR